MRKAFLSLSVFAFLVVGAFGCASEGHERHEHHDAMKMNNMACCSDACKKMAHDCCSTDSSGKASCSMGGSCCKK